MLTNEIEIYNVSYIFYWQREKALWFVSLNIKRIQVWMDHFENFFTFEIFGAQCTIFNSEMLEVHLEKKFKIEHSSQD